MSKASYSITGMPLASAPVLREDLIRRISSDHPEWGEDRIALELKVKLGVEHDPSTIRHYMTVRKGDGGPASATWRTLLTGHVSELWTMDLTTQPLRNHAVRYLSPGADMRSGVSLIHGGPR